MAAERIRVQREGRRTEVAVEGWPGADAPYQVTSSAAGSVPSDAELPENLREALGKRAARGGAGKGRVLRCLQVGGPLREPIVVGGLAYHVDGTSVEITALGTVTFKHEPEVSAIETVLIACAQEVSRLLGSDCVRWTVHSDAAAQRARSKHEFRRLSRARASGRWRRRGAILMERCRQTAAGRASEVEDS
jgi:hypothetical protein